MRSDPVVLARLASDGLVHHDGIRWTTTRRWQGAMARAASALVDDPRAFDLRLPVAHALVELYGADAPDDELAGLVEAMAAVEAGLLEG